MRLRLRTIWRLANGWPITNAQLGIFGSLLLLVMCEFLREMLFRESLNCRLSLFIDGAVSNAREVDISFQSEL